MLRVNTFSPVLQCSDFAAVAGIPNLKWSDSWEVLHLRRGVRQNSSLRGGERRWSFRLEQIAKRGFDIVFSLLALVFISPVLLLIAILVKLDSEGPVLYVSDRIGKNGKRFRFLKYRTMVRDADSLRGALLHLNERRGNLFKMSNDPRVTRLGRALRRYSLDELPQFFSVLTGHMSVVGPRPCLTSEYARYTKEQRRRVEAVPGSPDYGRWRRARILRWIPISRWICTTSRTGVSG